MHFYRLYHRESPAHVLQDSKTLRYQSQLIPVYHRESPKHLLQGQHTFTTPEFCVPGHAGSEGSAEPAVQSASASITQNGGWASRVFRRSAEKRHARQERKMEELAERRSRPRKGAVWSLFSWSSAKRPSEEAGLSRSASDLFDRHSGTACSRDPSATCLHCRMFQCLLMQDAHEDACKSTGSSRASCFTQVRTTEASPNGVLPDSDSAEVRWAGVQVRQCWKPARSTASWRTYASGLSWR